MAVNESWLPIISNVVSWVKDSLGPSKKDLKIQVKDLQEQVTVLAKGNASIIDNMSIIIRAILSELKASQYVINAEQVVYIGSNSGSVSPTSNTQRIENSPITVQKDLNYYADHFFVTDEEIALSRTKKRKKLGE